MHHKVDVLVVGLGPAGGTAALAAARGGLKVAAVERRKEVGLPVQCAEWIPLALLGLLPDLMPNLIQGGGINVQSVDAMITSLPSGETSRLRTPGMMINRAVFDQAIAATAERAGAALYLNCRLDGLDTLRHLASVESPQGKMTFSYRVLVAADGPSSSVAKLMGLPKQAVVHARQYTVPLLQPTRETAVWLSPDFPGGYAWLFPKGDQANLGLGMDKRFAVNLKTPLDNLHQKLVSEGRVGHTVIRRTGGLIPVGGLRSALVAGNVLFAGDAGGFTHPVMGAGIQAAVVSGRQAGEAAVACLDGRGRALESYEEDMRDHFEQALSRGVKQRVWLKAGGKDETLRKGWVAFPEYYAGDAA
ncbi:MAG: NAD(P)/FAD-dependent oxidoreductase [Sulfuricellaceae bacterium]|nr:NAD(P)/FAD-dependent oxidoreductase [Sulfuricellaceae bacterium]